MSYCRWGADSDVYVFGTERCVGDGDVVETWYVCFECPIGRKRGSDSLYAPTLAAMRQHLEAHRAEGHKVPDDAFERIDQEIAEGIE